VVESILKTNKGKGIDWSLLANKYELAGASIKKCVIKAVAQAGIRGDFVTIQDLLTACKHETALINHEKSDNSMFYT